MVLAFFVLFVVVRLDGFVVAGLGADFFVVAALLAFFVAAILGFFVATVVGFSCANRLGFLDGLAVGELVAVTSVVIALPFELDKAGCLVLFTAGVDSDFPLPKLQRITATSKQNDKT